MRKITKCIWCGGSLTAALTVFCFCGCSTVETDGSEVVESDSPEVLCRVEVPKGCPGKLEEKYLVIDISGGSSVDNWPVSYLDKTPENGWSDEYKTDKIVLRKVNAGSYLRQRCSAIEAWNRKAENRPREVYVDKSFYMGVFEITQRQYEHVMGVKPSRHVPAEGWEMQPVENVTYDDIRGRCKGACFPNSREVDAHSFIGILRQKTGLSDLDLPAEDVWEYCCSAGGAYIETAKLDPYACFSHYPNVKETNRAPNMVGSHKPNVLGLYDMQGNVDEWCLDYAGGGDPKPISSILRLGCNRVVKGGFYDALSPLCHSSIYYVRCSSIGDDGTGFRICKY